MRSPQLKLNLTVLGPWLAVLALSVMGLAVGLVETVRNADAPGSALSGAVTVAAVFGLMLVMSLYFIVARALNPDGGGGGGGGGGGAGGAGRGGETTGPPPSPGPEDVLACGVMVG